MTDGAKKTENMPENLTEVVTGIASLLLPEIKKQNDEQTFVIKRSLDNLSVNVSVMGAKVEDNTNKIQEIKDDYATLKDNLHQTKRNMKENRDKINEQILENRTEFDKIHSDISEIKDKMSNIWDICSQVESGKLGSYNLGADDIPTTQDMFDAKKSFMMAKHSVGLFPIWKEHVDEIRGQHNVTSDADAYRLCINQYLQCEMRFNAEFVRNIERHYVKLIYNGVDCLYIVFDDIDESGGRRILQEARQLWPRQKGDPETDPTLKKLEAPQWRLRLKAYEMFASSLRWDWNRANDDDFKRGIRCRTRIEFALGNTYDFVVQRQFPGERYQNVEWPVDERGQLPSIQWKDKRYRSQREIATYPKSLSAITKKDFVPPGRQIDRLTGQPREVFPIKVHTLVEGHNFVPGMVDPGTGELTTLNRVSGITDGLLEIAGARTQNEQVNPISDPAYDKGTGFGIGCDMIGTSLERDEAQKERDDRKKKIAAEKKAEEKAEEKRKAEEKAKAKAEREEKAKREAEKKEAEKKAAEKKRSEEEKKKKQTVSNSQQGGGFFSTFSFMGNVPASIRNILISPPKEGAKGDEEEKMDETQEDIEDDIAKLEKQQAELDKQTEKAEKVRYEEDKKREEEEERKKAAEDAEKQKSEVNKREESVTQMSGLSATPISFIPDTILAGQPSTARPLTQLTQQNISSFFAPKKSSTMTPGHFDTDNDTWGTPIQSPSDITMLVNTNDGSPELSRTLKFEDKDKTKEVLEDKVPPMSKTLEFKEDNYKIVPITPAATPQQHLQQHLEGVEKVKVTPAGGREAVEVTVSKDMGKVKAASKLPVAKLLTHQKIRKGRSLSESQKMRKKKFEELAKQKPKLFESTKRTEPESAREEENPKISRVISPEKSKKNDEDNTKAEDVTAGSDDLSSISVLECGSVEVTADTDAEVVVESEVNIENNGEEKEDGDTGNVTADNTVIKVEVNSQQPEPVTQQSTQPPPQEGDEPLKEVAKEAATADTGAKTADIGAETKAVTAGVKIVLEPGLVWDKSNIPSPEDRKSSDGDNTGHIVGVRAHTPLLNVDSNVDTSDNSSLMKKFTKPLKLAFKEDGEKKEEDDNLD